MTLNGITLTWAIPVDAAALGARMESYAETKASIHVFKLCTQHAHPGASLGRFSPELIEMVSNEVQNAAFNRRLQIWQDCTRCCANKCRPSKHLSKEDYESLREEHLAEDHDYEIMNGECGCNEEYLKGSGVRHDEHEHIEAVPTFLSHLESNNFYSRSGRWFQKCKRIIADDFGLEAYFTAFRDLEMTGDWPYPPVTAILAYLILPSVHSTLRTSSGSDKVSYLSSVIVDPSILHSARHDLFKVAMCTLQLEPVPLGQYFTCVVPTSTPLPPSHFYHFSSKCSKRNKYKETRDEAAQLAASSPWPKLMILGSGLIDAKDD
ncbi:hypothetical protein JMJ35_005678 [Cladonia borealis]|uniref:Uncharacterized protein n=1 Tax=Cladonia borealis TaxID=184061 RepID=A0AA39V137_9LECA|nr:hypothetical protein JMJ35_005678 [Cladonia borealis]